jgi:replicative DNA helicase
MNSLTIDLVTGGATSLRHLLDHLDDGLSDREYASIRPLGFDPLDRVLGGGLRPHDLMIVAGRPGIGKTVAVLQMARNLALSGCTVVFACFEHDEAALLARLLALEIGGVQIPHTDWYRMDGVRALLDEVMAGRASLASLSADPLLRAARACVDEYADRLHLVRAAPSKTGVRELTETIDQVRRGPTVLCVDYLQKVRASRAMNHADHVSEVTGDLRELSLETDTAVIAIAALNGAGLSRKRVHLSHLDTAAAVAYDADIVLLLEDKSRIVAANQLANTTDQFERFAKRVILTIEKNRGGLAPVDLEFIKDYEHFRFDPVGGFVQEQLVNDQLAGDLL